MRRMLLISSSTVHGYGYLQHCEADIRELLGDRERLLFVPYALHDQNAYAAKVTEHFAALGYQVTSLHESRDPPAAVAGAQAIFVGGGNTFRLLKSLWDKKLINPIRERVLAGTPYMGSSAGANVAGPTIKTTNDMPVVYPPSFNALKLIRFQINPHYLDPDPSSTHMGETREMRIAEYHDLNAKPVLGLREGAQLWIEGNTAVLRGLRGARLFRRRRPPEEYKPGDRLDFLMS